MFMDEILSGLHEFVVAYLNDILIYSQTWKLHLEHQDIVFGKPREAGLIVKERKCMFGSGSCEYLNHVVGNDTAGLMDCKVPSVRDFDVLQTKKDVRSFLGLCGYYTTFMQNFSTMATPLTELTKKRMHNKVKRTTQCDHAFSELKEALTIAPILVTSDWNLPFILQMDASAAGLGYVLSQVNGKGENIP